MSNIPKIHVPDTMGVDKTATSPSAQKDEKMQQEAMSSIPKIQVPDTIGVDKSAASPSPQKDEPKQQEPKHVEPPLRPDTRRDFRSRKEFATKLPLTIPTALGKQPRSSRPQTPKPAVTLPPKPQAPSTHTYTFETDENSTAAKKYRKHVLAAHGFNEKDFPKWPQGETRNYSGGYYYGHGGTGRASTTGPSSASASGFFSRPFDPNDPSNFLERPDGPTAGPRVFAHGKGTRGGDTSSGGPSSASGCFSKTSNARTGIGGNAKASGEGAEVEKRSFTHEKIHHDPATGTTTTWRTSTTYESATTVNTPFDLFSRREENTFANPRAEEKEKEDGGKENSTDTTNRADAPFSNSNSDFSPKPGGNMFENPFDTALAALKFFENARAAEEKAKGKGKEGQGGENVWHDPATGATWGTRISTDGVGEGAGGGFFDKFPSHLFDNPRSGLFSGPRSQLFGDAKGEDGGELLKAIMGMELEQFSTLQSLYQKVKTLSPDRPVAELLRQCRGMMEKDDKVKKDADKEGAGGEWVDVAKAEGAEGEGEEE